jgi:hypothetical protein
MTDPATPLRAQIEEAMARIARELEILQAPSSIGGGSNDAGVIAELEAEYQALKEARGRLGPHEL